MANPHPKYGSGIGREGDFRNMGQFINDELPRAIRSRTMAELRDMVTALRANYQKIGLTRAQAQQAIGMIEQRIAQTAPGGGAAAPASAAGAAAPPRPVPQPAIPPSNAQGIAPQALNADWEARRQEEIARQDAAGAAGVPAGDPKSALPTGRPPHRPPPGIPQQVFDDDWEARRQEEVARQDAEMAAPAPAVSPEATPPRRPPPRSGTSEGKSRKFDGMKIKDFMKDGEVLYIAINGQGLRNDGGSFVPAGR